MHYFRISPILFCILFVLTACSSNNKEKTEIGENEYHLTGRDRQELFMKNAHLAATDSLLIITSFPAEKLCRFYDLYDNLKEVGSYGTIGNGPDEYNQPLLTYTQGNTFGLNEVNQQKLYILEAKRENPDSVTIQVKRRLQAVYKREKGRFAPSTYYFAQVDSTHFVSLIGAENGRFFSLLGSDFSLIDYFGDSPIDENLSAIAAYNRLSGTIATSPGYMVYGCRKIPYLALYALENGKMNKKWSIEYAPTAYGVKNQDLLFDKNKAVGPMLNIKMDDKYIYILYMDTLLSQYDSKSTEHSYSNKILVYDYEGKKVATLHLDTRINSMAVHRNLSKLYGVANDPDLKLVEFDLLID